MKNLIRKKIDAIIKKEFKISKLEYDILIPEREEFGNFSTNVAFILAKKLKKSPKEIAETLLPVLRQGFEGRFSSKIEVAGVGFINFFMNSDLYLDELNVILKEKSKYGANTSGKKKKIQVEFISGNPTGPLTMGNGRGGFSGDTLANILKKNGYDVKKEYYVNDAGNQVKKVLAKSIYLSVGIDIEIEEGEDVYKGKYIDETARKIKKQKGLQWMNENMTKTGELAAKIILTDIIKEDIKYFGIKYDKWFSEKSLFDDDIVHKMWELLKKKNLVYENEGAYWIKSSQFGDDKDKVVKKSDGNFTYLMSDIAYFYERLALRKFDKVIIILGADHHSYVRSAQAVVKLLGFEGKLDVILAQFVRLIKDGEEVKMSKRKGTFITLREAVEDLGLEEARYFYISRDYNSHIDIDLDLAKEQSSQNPVYYVQYASARINSVLAKIKKQVSKKTNKQNTILDKYELAVIKKLSQYPELISEVGESHQVYKLAFYVHELATVFHKFYDNCRTIGDEREAIRLRIIKATKIVLEDCLGLMGIVAKKKM